VAIGAGLGALAGAAAGVAVNYSDAQPELRRHFEASPHRETHTWGEASPIYRYGWEAREHPEFRGHASYDDARPALMASWRGPGRYEDVEPMVRAGWERRSLWPSVPLPP
jgi:hypothetical protein